MKRRTLLKGMVVVGSAAAIKTAVAQCDVEQSCEIHAKALADALMKKYGSLWKIKMDDKNEFVLVYREVSTKVG